MTFNGLEPREETSWAYGANVEADEELENQFSLAHATYNRMVECGREALAAVVQWFGEKDAEVARLSEAIDRLSAQWVEAKARDDREQLKVIAEERRQLRKEWYERCFAVRKEHRTELNALLKEWVGGTKESRLYALRTEAVKSGLYWATATAVMTAFQRAWDKQWPKLRPVAFSRRAEKPRETLTVQFTESGGVPMDTVHAGHGSLWIGAPTDEHLVAWANGRRVGRAEQRVGFRMRIGGAGREGIYAQGVIALNRPVPEGARVMMARLVRSRVATKVRYSLQLVLRLAEPLRAKTERKAPRVALDVGWYYEAGKGRRVIVYTDADNEDATKVLYLDASIDEAFDRVDRMNSQRDRERDDVAVALRCCQWDDAPATLAEGLAAINKLPVAHVAPSRLAGLMRQWREEYPNYRPDVLKELWAWRCWDKRVYEAASHLRKRTCNRRRDFYRVWAKHFAERYSTIVVVRPDLREAALVKNEATGEHTELTPHARQGRVRAALYEFLGALPTKAADAGSVVIELTGRTTTECSACGETMSIPEDRPATRTLVCEACGVSHDRDANSAVLAFRVLDDDAVVEEGLEAARAKAEKKREARHKRREAMRQGRWKPKERDGDVGTGQ